MSGIEILSQDSGAKDLNYVPEVEAPYFDQIGIGLEPQVIEDLGYKFSINDISRSLLRSEVKLSIGLDFLPQTQIERTMAINGLNESLKRVKDKPLEATRRIFVNTIEALSSAQSSSSVLEKIQNDISVDIIKSSPQIMYEIAQFLTLENIFINMSNSKTRFPSLSTIAQISKDFSLKQLPLQNNHELVENYWQTLIDSRNRLNFWSDELGSVKDHPLAYKFVI